MTGPKGNSEFCYPETLNVSRGEDDGNIEVKGKQNSLFPAWPVIKCMLYLPTRRLEKIAKNSFASLRRLAHKFTAVSKSTTWSRASRKFMLLFP